MNSKNKKKNNYVFGGKMAVNKEGGLYVHGTKLPPMFRERVLDLQHESINFLSGRSHS